MYYLIICNLIERINLLNTDVKLDFLLSIGVGVSK